MKIHLTRQQVRQIDRRAIEEYHIPGVVLMENAARGVAAVALRMLRRCTGRRVLILCGGGNNGGDGLAAARHLHNHGCAVTVALYADERALRGDALTNWRIVQAMRLPTIRAQPDSIRASASDLVIDAIFGTGLAEAPRDPFPDVVQAVAQLGAPVLAVDLPSGLDCDSGQPLGACIRAVRTVTFVALKAGFANPRSRAFTGRVTVADIGCPRELIDLVAKEAGAGSAAVPPGTGA